MVKGNFHAILLFTYIFLVLCNKHSYFSNKKNSEKIFYLRNKFTGVSDWLSWWSIWLLILGLWVQAPRWVERLFRKSTGVCCCNGCKDKELTSSLYNGIPPRLTVDLRPTCPQSTCLNWRDGGCSLWTSTSLLIFIHPTPTTVPPVSGCRDLLPHLTLSIHLPEAIPQRWIRPLTLRCSQSESSFLKLVTPNTVLRMLGNLLQKRGVVKNEILPVQQRGWS